MEPLKVTFSEWECTVRFMRYPSDQIAIVLVTDDEYEELVARATVSLPSVDLAPDEVIVKDYSENEGMLAALIKAGIVSPPQKQYYTEFVTFPVCRLTDKAVRYIGGAAIS